MSFDIIRNGEERKFRKVKLHHRFKTPQYGIAFEINEWNSKTQPFTCPNCKSSFVEIDLKDITWESIRYSKLSIENLENSDGWEGYKLICCSECSSIYLIGIASHEFCNN